MLTVYKAEDQVGLDKFIIEKMNRFQNWTFIQEAYPAPIFPLQFVIVTDPNIKLAKIEYLTN